MRALRDEVKRHIESLKNIDKADVEIAMTEDELYTDKDNSYTAAVTVYLAPGLTAFRKKRSKASVPRIPRGRKQAEAGKCHHYRRYRKDTLRI
jgi:hypothetical protein